jgi:hypothetical protein
VKSATQYLVWSLGIELTGEHIRSDHRTLARIFRQATPPGTRLQSILAHQPFNAMKPAGQPFRQHIMPDMASTIGLIAGTEASPDLVEKNFIIASMITRRAIKPGMEART